MGIIGTVAKRKLRIARPVNSTIMEAAGGECTAIVLLKLAISYFLHNIPSTPSLKNKPKNSASKQKNRNERKPQDVDENKKRDRKHLIKKNLNHSLALPVAHTTTTPCVFDNDTAIRELR